MSSMIRTALQYTAWRMDAPEMFGAFHIAALLIAILLAASAAMYAKRLTDEGRIRLLSGYGWVLAALEIYKQLFLYYIVNGGVYDWWYFPFQLCSVPMYLCILLPVLHRRGLSGPVVTFLATYTFVGAAAALIIPEDYLRSYVSLTIHGFVWHGMLLFICFTIVFSGMANLSMRSFAKSTALFAGLCVIAVLINILAEPVMAEAHSAGLLPESYAAMFYLNPYHLSPQPLVDAVQQSIGIIPGLLLYTGVIIVVSGLVCTSFGYIRKGTNVLRR